MKITTKELRIQPGKINDHVAKGHEVIITYHGKARAKIIPLEKENKLEEKLQAAGKDEGIFGLWKDYPIEKSVEEQVRDLRKGREF